MPTSSLTLLLRFPWHLYFAAGRYRVTRSRGSLELVSRIPSAQPPPLFTCDTHEGRLSTWQRSRTTVPFIPWNYLRIVFSNIFDIFHQQTGFLCISYGTVFFLLISREPLRTSGRQISTTYLSRSCLSLISSSDSIVTQRAFPCSEKSRGTRIERWNYQSRNFEELNMYLDLRYISVLMNSLDSHDYLTFLPCTYIPVHFRVSFSKLSLKFSYSIDFVRSPGRLPVIRVRLSHRADIVTGVLPESWNM